MSDCVDLMTVCVCSLQLYFSGFSEDQSQKLHRIVNLGGGARYVSILRLILLLKFTRVCKLSMLFCWNVLLPKGLTSSARPSHTS